MNAILEDIRRCLNQMEESESKLERQRFASYIRIRVDGIVEKLIDDNAVLMMKEELESLINVYESKLKKEP